MKPESSYFRILLTPAFAGVTTKETFYEFVNNRFIRHVNWKKQLSQLTTIQAGK
jgi:hypothetical protein